MRTHIKLPWIVLVASLLLTATATWMVADSVRVREDERLEHAAQSMLDRIDTRMATYMTMLRGGAALFATDDSVTQREFYQYAKNLGIRQFYPGIQGIGYSHRLGANQAAPLQRQLRASGMPQFRYWPDSTARDLHAILFLEPLDQRNQAAIGFNMFSEPVRRAAMERARDTGLPSMSGKVELVQEISGPKQAGFLVYVPVYHRPVDLTTAQRRMALQGFVYAPFRADDLLEGIFNREDRPDVAYRIYDGAKAIPEKLLHDSAKAGITAARGAAYDHEVRLAIGGQVWTVSYAPTESFDSASRFSLAPAILISGLLLSVLLFYFSRSQLRTEETKRARAEQLAAEAREREVRLYAAELENTNRELRDFANIASHDLQEPLRKISVFSDLVLSEYSPRLDEEGRSYLVGMQRAALRMSQLIKDLLAFSNLDSRHVELVKLNAVVREAAEQMLLEEPAPAPAWDVQDLPTIEADAELLVQLFKHLFGNAVKFRRPEEPPRIAVQGRIDWSMVRSPADIPVCQIEVADNGIGFDERFAERIFTPFQRLHAQQNYPGTGMGLAICRRIVERHRGSITARSAPGEGSTFIIRLPVRRATLHPLGGGDLAPARAPARAEWSADGVRVPAAGPAD